MLRNALLAAVLLGSPAAAQKLPGAVSGCGTVAIPKTEASDVPKLTTGAECFERVKVIADGAAKVRRDRLAVLKPPPPPMDHPHPMPVPNTGWEPTPTLEGMAPIGSGLDVSSLLEKSWGTGAIPGPELADVEGAFRFLCAPSHNAYDDPIVYPGQPGKSHLHTFFGNTKADANSTYQSLRTSGDSTCNSALNRSAYWIPTMMNGRGKVVMPDWVSIYYKRAPKTSKFCAPPYADRCAALPRGLRYIFGFNMIDPTKNDPAGFRWFNCDGLGAVSGHFATIAEATKGCPTGARLGAVIVGPNCWDGKHLDSPDHRTHMAYQAQDGNGRAVCPKSHPVLLPFFELGAWYAYDGSDYVFSSDQQMQRTAGETFHADWWGAWEDSILKRWTDNCIDRALSCSGGDLGDGWQLKTTKGYDYPSGRPLLDPPAR